MSKIGMRYVVGVRDSGKSVVIKEGRWHGDPCHHGKGLETVLHLGPGEHAGPFRDLGLLEAAVHKDALPCGRNRGEVAGAGKPMPVELEPHGLGGLDFLLPGRHLFPGAPVDKGKPDGLQAQGAPGHITLNVMSSKEFRQNWARLILKVYGNIQ